MKKILLIIFVSAITFHLSAQISEGGLPPSFKSALTKGSTSMASHTMTMPDTASLALYNIENPTPLRYAVLENVDLELKECATRTVMSDGGTIWQYRINSPAGKSLQVIFSKYLVPDGAQLYLYNDDYSAVRGAYTGLNITEDLMFVTGDFPGDYVIIEYYEPAGVEFEGEINIGSVGQAYIDILNPKSGNVDEDGFIGINCDEGVSLQYQKHSVCKYTFNDGQYSYLCTGSLINTVNNDGTPYFLTASHCINTDSEASTIVAYFNYEEAACTSAIVNPLQTLSGSSLKTTGSGSDYTLLEFTNLVPSSYKPYFAGWDAGGAPPENSSCIHHPGGGTKKIAVDYDPAFSLETVLTWEGGAVSPSGSHWAVTWDEGTTAGGSSGAPLFDQNHRISGQLHGGSTTDFFGKLSYSWLHPGSSYSSLKSFLDPGSTGVESIDGYYPEDNLPDPQFLSHFSKVCTDAPVEFSGFSAFEPLEWSWSFFPLQIEYLDGTSSSSPSPRVSFHNDRYYNVTLRVTNNAGTAQLTVNNYIIAGSDLELRAYPSGMADSCVYSFTGLTLQAYGADAYEWALTGNSVDQFYIANNTANPVEIRIIDGVPLTQSTDIEITMTGIQGTCQGTLGITIPLEAQTNDFVADAIEIGAGASGPFSNSCATIEDGEPIPPYDSCTGQLSWCDEYDTGENIVERSVWFTYTPEVNKIIMLSSTGMDNEIAVYRAASAEDLLAGNYVLEAANDDYSDTDFNPKINSIEVKANQKYWIQVDGSAGGITGTFYLRLSVLVAEIVPASGIKVYPQPAADYVNFASAAFYGCPSVRVEMVDVSGRIVLNTNLIPSAGRVQLQLGKLSRGVYMARLYCNGEVKVVKVII
jgi:hypothetical protein